METLYEYLKSVYSTIVDGTIGFEKDAFDFIKKTSFDELMSDEKKCIDFIVKTNEFESDSSTLIYNKYRAKHIVVTFLLGVGLMNNFHLKESIESNIRYNTIWLQTSMLHDYGYFLTEFKKNDLTIDDLTFKHNLLTDIYNDDYFNTLNGLSTSGYSMYFPYSYDEIKKYFEYKKKYFENEPIDHGILGGCVAFSKYCDGVIKLDKSVFKNNGIHHYPSWEINRQQKIACYTAAAHNIFKSSKDDDKYLEFGLDGLLSISPKRITSTHKLLMLLSLVDTVECSKRFSKKESPDSFLQQKTILKNIEISIGAKELSIDYSGLFNIISLKEKNIDLMKQFEYQIDSVSSIDTWTDFKANKLNDYGFKIGL